MRNMRLMNQHCSSLSAGEGWSRTQPRPSDSGVWAPCRYIILPLSSSTVQARWKMVLIRPIKSTRKRLLKWLENGVFLGQSRLAERTSLPGLLASPLLHNQHGLQAKTTKDNYGRNSLDAENITSLKGIINTVKINISYSVKHKHLPIDFPSNKVIFHCEEAQWFPTGGDISIPWGWGSI